MFHIPGYSWDSLYITKVSIRKKDKTALSRYQFSVDGREFNNSVERGPLYRSRRDAAVAAAWEMCEAASKQLQLGWDAIRKEMANADPV